MVTEKIVLKNPERFSSSHTISKQKLIRAAEKATDKLLSNAKKFGFGFPGTCSVNHRYVINDNVNWESGMYTGCFWLAYELTGEKEFKDIAESHLSVYKKCFDDKVGINNHDVGFIYTPSCVAAYKLTGNEFARKTALDVARYYYDTSYSEEGRFIIRSFGAWNQGSGCRTMMDSLMNAPFLFWASKESGNVEYFEAAYQHNITTEKLLIRDDASSFHHYQFDPKTAAPVRGLTFQGYSDDSCWARGHSWGVYGFPIAYSYTKDSRFIDVHKNITYYMLNHLPGDYLPYWDYIFNEASKEPRDSSCAVISACGLNEMCKYIDEKTEEKAIYQSAASQMLEAVIDKCTLDDTEYDGLINHVTHAVPQKQGIDECAVYGDYFYLEVLLRYLKPEWKMYW